VLIRINSAMPTARRRFTLAHELGHLLLGVPTVVGETVYDSLRSDNAEERQVNNLAGELLLPETFVRQSLPAVPVVAAQLRKLARKARVSELMAAIRVANLAKQVGLINASVAFFRSESLEWNWSKTLKMPSATAVKLLDEARKSDPNPARIPRTQTNDVIVASLIENPQNKSATLFVQLLPAEVGNQLTSTERRQQLEHYLFGDDNEFRMQLQGVFGAFRPKCQDLTVDAAFQRFFAQKGEKWQGTRRSRLHSAKGQEYVRLRLRDWCTE
jgi:hypothetical protein